MKKTITLLVGLLCTLFVSAQLFEYEGGSISKHNYQTGQHVEQTTSVEGNFKVDTEIGMASFTFEDLFDGSEITETMTIVTSETTPSTVSFIALTEKHVRYDVFIDYSAATVQFVKVSWLGDFHEQANTYPHVETYVFNVTHISAVPQHSWEQHEKKRGKGNVKNFHRPQK